MKASFIIFTVAIGGVILQNRMEAQELTDSYRWLEEVESEEALDWVRERNSQLLERAEADPEYRAIRERVLEVLDDSAKIDYPSFRGGYIYNFWKSAEHERGIIRRTSLEGYLADSDEWEVILDIDRLASEEEENWVFHGSVNLKSDPRYGLIQLSRGGADASVIREFDWETKSFRPDGFMLPEAKSQVVWVDPDHLIVGTDMGEGTLTSSGYPRTLRLWERGTELKDAPVIAEGEPTDVSIRAWSHRGVNRDYLFIGRAMTFYEGKTWLLEGDQKVLIDVPDDAGVGMFRDMMTLRLQSDWKVGETTYMAGSLLAIDVNRFLDGDRSFDILFEPSERSAIQGYAEGRDYLYISTLENVMGKVYRLRYEDGVWQKSSINLPSHGSVSIISNDEESNRLFLGYTDYLTPSTLFYHDPDESTDVRAVRSQPAYFNADPYIVEQLEATSSDGTAIPYFMIRRKDLQYDGKAPTILYGYGGFRVSQTPYYSAATGIAWLEKGGVYVVANIRGGGEFGPEWHAAALKENRQRAYDDFIAIAEDLIARKITSPEHLGISGGSNGGLLVGVAFTQRPDLFNAVSCAVPLLDMRNYHTMLAGASWMGEYGNPDIPEEWEYISSYSPYHNLDPDTEYPEVLFLTSTRDDRVHPGHARKMAARMEEMGHPYLYYENIEGGHGGAANNEQLARRIALSYIYFLWKLAGHGTER